MTCRLAHFISILKQLKRFAQQSELHDTFHVEPLQVLGEESGPTHTFLVAS
jgi:hypothetical protein